MVAEGSPADIHGLKKGDLILSINKENVFEENPEVIRQILKESGSSVEIGVVRSKYIDANLCKSLYNHYSDCHKGIFY